MSDYTDQNKGQTWRRCHEDAWKSHITVSGKRALRKEHRMCKSTENKMCKDAQKDEA